MADSISHGKHRISVMAAVERYILPARVLHWGVAGVVVVLLALGLVMTRGTLSIERLFAAYQWHKTLGVLVFLTMVVRLGVRFGSPPPPPLPADLSPARQRFARAVHAGLYVALLLMPMSGWLMASAAPLTFPISLFGVDVPLFAPLQAMPEAARGGWFEVLKTSHSILAGCLGVLVVLHVAGALWHGRALRQRMSLFQRSNHA
jgi:cytochrome b561